MEKFKIYIKAAEQGDMEAQYYLGLAHFQGIELEQDYTKALDWCLKAAEQGHADAQNLLGLLYFEGLGTQKNYEQGIDWIHKSAQQNNLNAQFSLGFFYQNGQGVQKDYDKSIEWYSKAANQGLATAQVNLGIMYIAGNGIQKNYDKAVKLLEEAANQDSTIAMVALSKLYFQEIHDHSKALAWCLKAAELGDLDSQFTIGGMYYNGQYVKKDIQKAFEWTHKAAIRGHKAANKALQDLFSGFCLHCGGQLGGFFVKRCKVCGKKPGAI